MQYFSAVFLSFARVVDKYCKKYLFLRFAQKILQLKSRNLRFSRAVFERFRAVFHTVRYFYAGHRVVILVSQWKILHQILHQILRKILEITGLTGFVSPHLTHCCHQFPEEFLLCEGAHEVEANHYSPGSQFPSGRQCASLHPSELSCVV